MNILIIGSKGFIGSHAYNYFSLQKGVECWGCDVVVDYVEPRYILIDSSNSDFHEIFEKHQFDICINCSGAASVPDSLINPFRDFLLNTLNVLKILDAIRKYTPNCKFINLSSAAVYGNPSKFPVAECDISNPISPYGTHKLFAEEICREYYQYFGIQTCSLRIFSAYGPGLKKQLFWDLYKKQQVSNKVDLYGSGKETRDFIYVTDIVKAIDCVIKKGLLIGDRINVANGKAVEIASVATYFVKLFSSENTIEFTNKVRTGDPQNWCADTSKLNSLGYEESVNMETGLKKYKEWLIENE
jgi:UDP-glucose 4-epimerase